MENTDFEKVKLLFCQPGDILIVAHSNPDGDAIGSSLALGSYLQKKGHRVNILVPDPYPEFLAWLPGVDRIHIFKQDKYLGNQLIDNADIIIATDFNQLDRLGDASETVIKSGAKKILIDHHLDPSSEFTLKISVTGISSTSELVYHIIEKSGDLSFLDKQIAECIYTGIITDTGSLSYACNYIKTYQILAELFRQGIDGEMIHRNVYDTYSENRLRLLGFSISDNLTVLPEFNTAFIRLSKKDLERFAYQIGDTEGIVNYALSIKDINLAALFTERDDVVKVSFRSKGNFSVCELAREYFSGGGHRNAAGANCNTSLEETIRKFLEILPLYKNHLKKVYP